MIHKYITYIYKYYNIFMIQKILNFIIYYFFYKNVYQFSLSGLLLKVTFDAVMLSSKIIHIKLIIK